MWTESKKQKTLDNLENLTWDIVIIGGGITGAGIFAEASRNGLKVLLVEQNDFCWGTSSRSSKMIHGGLRYLLQGDFLLTYHAAREREFLLKKYAGLIDPLPFVLPLFKGRNPPRWLARVGIVLYDLLAGHWNHEFWNRNDVISHIPSISRVDLEGGVRFVEASTDDVRLVLRLLHEGTNEKCYPLNYMEVSSLIKDQGSVVGAILRDSFGKEYSVKSRIVINASGIWVDQLRAQLSEKPHMRPLRGSHLLFSNKRFPLSHTVSFLHPKDQRPVFACPWQGCTMVGTTDLDHKQNLNNEPSITQEEVDYLLSAMDFMFPDLNLKESEAISSFSGIRPIIGTGKKDPSKELRDHALWLEHGLLTVSGGKYTTFRLIARETLQKVSTILSFKLLPLEKSVKKNVMTNWIRRRLYGFYGDEIANELIPYNVKGNRFEQISDTPYLWSELQWSARNEAVQHLSDLLLRRTRIGLLLPKGGLEHFEKIKEICSQELHWSKEKWESEKEEYFKLIKSHYSLPSKQFNYSSTTGS